MSAVRRFDPQDERGVAMVLFAVMLPLILLLGVISVDVGNWWVHKRHLQTQVDAGALAGGPLFVGCFLNPSGTNDEITAEALKYAGDWRRDNSTVNLQVQEPIDVYIALNSSRYWQKSDGDDPNQPAPGYGLDTSMDGDPSTPPPAIESSHPCDAKFLDVKGTDRVAPLLWGLIPFPASPKAKAKVEIRKVKGLSGFLPWAVPENAPKTVVALFVDESETNEVDSMHFLTPPASSSDTEVLNGETVSVWDGLASINVVDSTGLIIFQSRQVLTPTDLSGKSLSDVCAIAGSQCFGRVKGVGTTNQTGIGFIYGETGPPGPNVAAVYDANSADSVPATRLLLIPPSFSAPPGNSCASNNPDSAPYFLWNADGSDCDVRLQVQMDFGANVPLNNREVRVRLNSPYGNTCNTGSNLTKVSNSPPLWESPWITIPAGSGRNLFYLCWSAGNGKNKIQGNFGGRPIQLAFAANTAQGVPNTVYSGPIAYASIRSSSTGCAIDAHSLPKTLQTVCVAIGLLPPLRVSDGNAPPIFLRTSGSGSLNQMLDCDPPNRGPDEEVATGCATPYQVNTRALQCSPNPTWSQNNLPPTLSPSDPNWIDPDCIEANPGDVTSMAKGLRMRFEDPPPSGADCPPNLWEQYRADGDVPPPEDPRFITLVIADYGEFDDQGIKPLPITKFAGFYATGWFVGGGNQGTQGCAENDPPPTPPFCSGSPCDPGSQKVQGAVWGYFVTQVFPSSAGKPSDELCAFDELGTCIAVLVE